MQLSAWIDIALLGINLSNATFLWDGSGVLYPVLDVHEHVALDTVTVQKEVEPLSPNRVIALLQVRECSMGLNALLSPFLE